MTQQKFKMQILLLTDTLIGSDGGYGAIIDKDSVFDEVGLPIIPGKRIKGIMREQADLIKQFGNLGSVDELFGKTGSTEKDEKVLSVSNFLLSDYEANKTHLKYLIQKKIVSRSEVIDHFTSLRMMTKIEKDGIAADTSLRTIRVLNSGLIFYGYLHFDTSHKTFYEKIVLLSRRIGSMRNRGLGHIQCSLMSLEDKKVEPEKILTV